MLLLLAAAARVLSPTAPVPGPCDGGPAHQAPSFCNVSLPVHARVLELLSQLTLDEKLSLMGTDGASIPRLKIPQLRWGTECLHGVVSRDYADPAGTQPLHGPVAGGGATVFPQPLCTAASFDRALLGQIGEAIGTEARALNNAGMAAGTADATAFLSCWAPNINVISSAEAHTALLSTHLPTMLMYAVRSFAMHAGGVVPKRTVRVTHEEHPPC